MIKLEHYKKYGLHSYNFDTFKHYIITLSSDNYKKKTPKRVRLYNTLWVTMHGGHINKRAKLFS